jgi:hypothetical protein
VKVRRDCLAELDQDWITVTLTQVPTDLVVGPIFFHYVDDFALGPAFTLKPSPHTRIDLAPLLGTTRDSPYLELFVIFSINFGNRC